MPRKIVDTDDWRTRLELLHQELGARRLDLYRDLGVELRALLGITPTMCDQGEDVYGQVASWLEGMISNFQPKLGTPETVFLSLRVSYNVEIGDLDFSARDALERTSIADLWLGKRHKRLASGRSGNRVGESTSRAYVTQFHEQFDPKIKAELEAKGIIPSDDTTPVPPEDTHLTEQTDQTDAIASAEPSAPSETSTEPDAPDAPVDSPAQAEPELSPVDEPSADASADRTYRADPLEDSLLTPELKPLVDAPRQAPAASTDAVRRVLDPAHWSTPEDDVLAVLALSGGTRGGLDWAGGLLFRTDGGLYHDYVRHCDAIILARKRGLNREQVLLARTLCAERGSLAVDAGRIDIVASGLSTRKEKPYRLKKEYALLRAERVVANEYQRISLEEGGRLDLAGDWTSTVVMDHAEDLAERSGRNFTDSMKCAVIFDGLRKATLDQLIGSHPMSLFCMEYTARILFRHGTVVERLAMATWILELATCKNRTTARGDSQRYISELLVGLQEFGISTSRDPATLADELTAVVGAMPDRPNFTGANLIAQSRL